MTSPTQFTLTADQAAATVARSVLFAPYRSVAALSVAVRAWAYVVPLVMYVVSARYQILPSLSWPMPETVEPLQVGELCGRPPIVLAPLPSASRYRPAACRPW